MCTAAMHRLAARTRAVHSAAHPPPGVPPRAFPQKLCPAGACATLISAVLDRGGLAPVKSSADDGPIDTDNLRNLSLSEIEDLIAKRSPRPSGPPRLAVVGEGAGDAEKAGGVA